ncbi:MAG: GDSL-type esterase/lipase family protein [Ilumatobacteraceae bacterium]
MHGETGRRRSRRARPLAMALAFGSMLALLVPTTGPAAAADDDGPASSTPASSTPASSTPAVPQTSCRAVAHIGDSISVGMNSSAYIPDRASRIGGQYERIGVQDVELDISGARSIVEHLDGQLGGEAAARKLRRQGFEGCWVIALGTNDAANVAVGSGYGYSERIDRMMAIIGDDPVLWVDVKTLRERGPYAAENMRRWNTALAKAHARYPALRVFDWSLVAADRWFLPDGIHYSAEGYAYRAALIAGALAETFPA